MLAFAPLPAPPPELRPAPNQSGEVMQIGQERSKAVWLWRGSDAAPEELWLPLEVLESRLGFRRVSRLDGEALEWFGRTVPLTSTTTRSLGDEVGLEVSDLLAATGVSSQVRGTTLELRLPPPTVNNLRRGKGSTADRLVLDLTGPALVQRLNGDLLLELKVSRTQRRQLKAWGLTPEQHRHGGLVLKGQATKLRSLSLASPWRVVLDGVQVGGRRPAQSARLPLSDPAVARMLRRGFVLERRTIKVGVKPIQVFRAGGDLSRLGITLQPLVKVEQQQGLRFLPQLSQPAGALVAVNGGFFNRINQLPLGALRHQGVWLSGPILNRGVIAWGASGDLQFGRLRLNQTLQVNNGRRWSLMALNSGYVQKGLSLYTPAWGPRYRALSGEEEALLIRGGRVETTFDQQSLQRGIAIPKDAALVIARGRTPLPARPGDRIQVKARSSSPLAQHPNVLGGGPLLMQNGQVVLNGRQEGFSPGFMSLAAPRTVVAQGPSGQWLMTLRGAAGGDPTLVETALVAQQLGLRDALNMDGGSSTTLVVAGRTVMNGRGSTPRVHNGLGLIPL
ncbi:phosphodiester glycosidase family protein [Synechococcus sp. MU1642]|uniref:phosphodiester glycosidase family protein n=1 Tax=Synechococcus sp. MU1642 TaxID=2508348 RepID=UPI001CF8B33C|nr:phosphodiester glycosidase family protein [Synechococcus sp. MU1642]MCB4408299.1 phosphodiester glycosidase family protein [Synechococcus sp. MU1642]